MLELTAPGIEHRTQRGDRGARTVWMPHPDSSWARAHADDPRQSPTVHQSGPRRLWNLLEEIRDRLNTVGELPIYGAAVTINPDGETHSPVAGGQSPCNDGLIPAPALAEDSRRPGIRMSADAVGRHRNPGAERARQCGCLDDTANGVRLDLGDVGGDGRGVRSRMPPDPDSEYPPLTRNQKPGGHDIGARGVLACATASSRSPERARGRG